MLYSIGEVSKITGISISTLRYYDKEGLFPSIIRNNGGIRAFSDTEMEIIKIIECLKATGMPIKDIKRFMDWCQEGDNSLQNRLDMFNERLQVANKQLEEMQKIIETIQYKCWYYNTAVSAGSENYVRNLPYDDVPDRFKNFR